MGSGGVPGRLQGRIDDERACVFQSWILRTLTLADTGVRTDDKAGAVRKSAQQRREWEARVGAFCFDFDRIAS
jgi:hypothetical protein